MIEPTRKTMPATTYCSSKSSTAATMLSDNPQRSELVRGHAAPFEGDDAAARERAGSIGVPGFESMHGGVCGHGSEPSRRASASARASDERSISTDERSARRHREPRPERRAATGYSAATMKAYAICITSGA